MRIHQSSFLRHTFAILIILAMVLGAFPNAAQAATCDTYYTVKSGDTKTKIAKLYKIKWREIAEANDLEEPYNLKVGQKLCIPYNADDDEELANPKLRLRVSATHTIVTLTLSGLSDKKAVFIVRMRDATIGIGGWQKLGRIKLKKNSTSKETFRIPKEFKNTLYLRVCIKNSSTDELTCQVVLHP
ncbi:MAG TPA: LysM peptidoglycan-binding domain-containing protein [Anaerolineales bacterium]